ncbi:MAG: type II secretion system protein N [Pseudomonadales bacterium]
MKRTLFYVLVGLLSFAGFIVVFGPASAIWNLVKADVKVAMPDLKVSSVAGTAWNGSANLKYRDLPDATLRWTTNPGALLGGQLSFDTQLAGTGQDISGPLVFSTNEVNAQFQGKITSEFVNPLSTRYGLTFPGSLTIEHLALVTDGNWFKHVSGAFYWDGGPVHYDTYQGLQEVLLPPLSGELEQQGEEVLLRITHEGKSLINITLQPTGWARIEIKTRLFVLAQLPWPTTSDLDAPVLLMEEKLF